MTGINFPRQAGRGRPPPSSTARHGARSSSAAVRRPRATYSKSGASRPTLFQPYPDIRSQKIFLDFFIIKQLLMEFTPKTNQLYSIRPFAIISRPSPARYYPDKLGQGRRKNPRRSLKKNCRRTVAAKPRSNYCNAISNCGSGGPKIQRDAVYAIAQPGRGRAIRKDMAKVRSATAAVDLRPRHSETAIRRRAKRAGQRIEETWPARTAIEFFPGPEQRLFAAGAMKDPGPFFVIESAAARPLGPVGAHDLKLLGGQPFAPFRFREGHGKNFFLHFLPAWRA